MSPANSFQVLGLFSLTPHRLVHLLAFGFLSACLSLASPRPNQRVLALFAVIALGAFVETVEFFTTTNPFELWDVRDDTYAACAGFALAQLYFSTLRLFR